jgi:predicted metal-binding membrane protein
MAHHQLIRFETLLAATASWTAMMALMMTPTVGPWVAAYHRFGLTAGEHLARVRGTLLFASGYFAVWSLFGAVLAVAQMKFAITGTWSGEILAGAGLFQFTPLKQACLTHCRNPFSFLLLRWKDGPLSAFRLGMSHGTFCLGCCWALMLTSLAVGFMSLWWMAVLAALTFVEQVMPWGARLRVPIGVALLAVGVLYLAG